MAAEVIAPEVALATMCRAVTDYFCSDRRVCLIGALALDKTRDKFATAIRAYFSRWFDALTGALIRTGADKPTARRIAEEAGVAVQGALILARALINEAVFVRTIRRLRAAAPPPS